MGLIFGIITAISAVYQGMQQQAASNQAAKNAQAQADRERMMAEHNAKERENQAKQEELNRKAAKDSEMDKNRRRQARIEAAYAKSGVMLEGTPANFLTEQAAVDEMNVQRGDQKSAQRALGLRYAGSLAKNEGIYNASMYEQKAKSHKAAGKSAFMGGLLSGAGKAAGAFASASGGPRNGGNFSWEKNDDSWSGF